jgi:F-type H+-transporting ATPase subunit b
MMFPSAREVKGRRKRGGNMEFNATYYVIEMITFLIGLTLSAFIYLPYLKGWMEKRQKRIEDQLATAEQRQKDAEKLKSDFETKVHEVEQKTSATLKEARLEAQKISGEITLAARKEAEKILFDAHAMIEAEHKAVVKDIQKEMGNLAVAIAEKIIRQSVDVKAQEKIVAETIKEMGAKKN